MQVGFLKRISLQILDTVALTYFFPIVLPASSLVLCSFYIPLTKHTKLNWKSKWCFLCESSLLVSVFAIGLVFFKKESIFEVFHLNLNFDKDNEEKFSWKKMPFDYSYEVLLTRHRSFIQTLIFF